jgi:peptidoglycan/LPS O-acetylase OafA/YrhL
MRWLALAILVLGAVAAAAIYFNSPEESTDPDYAFENGLTRRDQMELRRLGGNALVAAVEFNAWLDSLWHGRRLAGTVLGIAAIGALGCQLAAKFSREGR